jgi:Prenyltransferase and squalene oxidase repeat
MPTGSRLRRVAALSAVLAAVTGGIGGLRGPAALAGTGAGPNLVKGSAYLVSPANLIGGHYYSSFGRDADFGLTIDGAFALAATGDEDRALKRIVSFLADGGRDAGGKTVNYWTGIGTRYASGGAIGKEALLAEVVGANPRDFGARNLIAALDASICPRAAAGGAARCQEAGSYSYASSVFDQALGVLAQLRAGQRRQSAAPVRYLESLQHADGSFPSLIPGTGGDVDSTAMAVMALALVPGRAAAADVRSGLAWIAGRQEQDGGFPGAGGDSVNSAGLAIQALTLRRAGYRSRIAAAEEFLAREQNANGGFTAYADGPRGSDLRASTQALGGAVGTPFGSLRRAVDRPATGGSGLGSWIAYLAVIAIGLALVAAVATAEMRRRHRLRGAARARVTRADPVGRPGP